MVYCDIYSSLKTLPESGKFFKMNNITWDISLSELVMSMMSFHTEFCHLSILVIVSSLFLQDCWFVTFQDVGCRTVCKHNILCSISGSHSGNYESCHLLGSLYVNRRFVGTYHLHLQGKKISCARNHLGAHASERTCGGIPTINTRLQMVCTFIGTFCDYITCIMRSLRRSS
jgi:hypothetical protein